MTGSYNEPFDDCDVFVPRLEGHDPAVPDVFANGKGQKAVQALFPECRSLFNWRMPAARLRRRCRGKEGCKSHRTIQTAGRRSLRLRSHSRMASDRQSPSTETASRGCVKPSLLRLSAPRDSGLTPSSYTARMATCCTSSSRRSPTDATM